MEENYLETNRELWNERTRHHITSDFYDISGFMEGKEVLNSIELDLLGDIRGKSILHLQCHFGMDSIALSRRGAKVTGVDFSDEAITKAQQLAKDCGTDTRFILSDVIALGEVLDEQFDIVFTSYGTIGWLPDMDQWAAIVNRFMKPDGHFVFAEFHPVVWMMDYDFKGVAYSYFNLEAIVEASEGTYTDRNAAIKATEVSWNHDLSEVVTALLNQGLQLKAFREFDYTPYDCFKHTVKIAEGKFRIKGLEGKLPMVYALRCSK